MKKVSVIVPVYNTENYLKECLDSLVSQTISDIEVILTVDEKSDDNSLNIANEYAMNYPDIIKVIIHPHGLPGDSRNYGLDVVTGEYIGFVDSDDLVFNTMFDTLYQKAIETDADIVCCDIEYLYTDGTSKIRKINADGDVSIRQNPSLLPKATCYVWNKIYRKELIDRYNFRFPKNRWYEDSSLIYNVMLMANKISLVPFPFYQYKVRREGSTAHVSDKRIFDVLLSAQDIVEFYKTNDFFSESTIPYLFKLCRIHINVRFDNIDKLQDIKMAQQFVNEVFDFYDNTFPNWENYVESVNKHYEPLNYAKQNRKFAINYFSRRIHKKFTIKIEHNMNSKEYYLKCLTKKIDNKAILYEAYEGAGMNCNPYALFLSIIKDPYFRNYKHIWSVLDKTLVPQLKHKWPNSNIKFVVRGEEPFFKALATSKYLINNNTFPPYFVKRKEQIYITSWHAVTVKTLGYDYPEGRYDSWNQVRNYMATDWFIAANDFMKNNLATAYKMDGIFKGKIIQEGYPRNDFFQICDKNKIESMLNDAGIFLSKGKKLVLYAPTWKGEKVSSPEIDVETMDEEIKRLENIINLNDYQILVKPHHVVYRNLSIKEKKSGKYIPPYIETNELLSMVDILISDYSSIFIDFMYTKRPVLFYIPDYDKYDTYRGIYFNFEELPGPISEDIEEIGNYINSIEEIINMYKEKYNLFYDRMFENGKDVGISSRIVDAILKNNYDKYNVISFDNNRIKLLVYPGDLKKAINSYRAKQLINALDSNIFDVTMMVDDNKELEEKDVLDEMSSNVRIVYKRITPPKTIKESKTLKYFLMKNKTDKYSLQKYTLDRMFKREYRRRFGDINFDAIINLEPQNRYYYCLLSRAANAVHIIWPNRSITIKKARSIFKEKCHEKFIYKQYYVLEGMDKKLNIEGIKPVYIERFIDNNCEKNCLNSEELHKVVIKEDVYVKKYGNMPIISSGFNFVCLTSCEKGGLDVKLIYAFKELSNNYSNIALYILSEGIQFNRLKETVRDLELNDKVVLISDISDINKKEILKKCDCLIEIPDKKEQLNIEYIRMAQILNKIVLLNDTVDGFQINEECGVIKTENNILDLYKSMKKICNENSAYNLSFSIEEHNKYINEKLLELISEPEYRNNTILHNFYLFIKRKLKRPRVWINNLKLVLNNK